VNHTNHGSRISGLIHKICIWLGYGFLKRYVCIQYIPQCTAAARICAGPVIISFDIDGA